MNHRILCVRNKNNKMPLTFTAVQANSAIALNKIGSPPEISLWYSINGSNYQKYNIGDIIQLNKIGDNVSFKGTTSTFSNNSGYYNFAMSGEISATGNTNSLINHSSLTRCCYFRMFYNCTSLTTAPQLPATNLVESCYSYMFHNCTSLINNPQLPATNLANMCYSWMFQNCTHLTNVSQLPATNLANMCYLGMFYNCTSLTIAPQLPATNLQNSCYQNMFDGCTSLTTAPQLPATTLATNCYNSMFYDCESLAAAPYLPASTLVHACYASMFFNCKKLNFVMINFKQWLQKDDATSNWLQGVAAAGMFVCIEQIEEKRGVSYVPYNWEIKNTTILTFTAVQNNSAVALKKFGIPSYISLQYKLNNNYWTNYTIGDIIPLSSINDKVSFKGTTNVFSKNTSNYYRFAMSGKISASGNTNSLINYSQFTPYCYSYMFNGCTNLTTAPQLPASSLASYCYSRMFQNCTSLTTAPQLPASSLASYCYSSMFQNCTSLTTAPQLPATKLANCCYESMFYNCRSLTTAPQLPAIKLANWCYESMFNGCTSLSSINVSFLDWYDNLDATSEWLSNVKNDSSCIFTCPAALGTQATITRGPSNCPTNWTVINK